MNIFEQATRLALRFGSSRNDLTTEQLWAVPLRSTNGFNLSAVGREVQEALKVMADTDDLVGSKPDPDRPILELKLEIVKHIIAVKLEEEKTREDAAAKSAKRRKLLELIASKQDEALSAASIDELQKQLDALDA